jgi:arylsulfatase A-like enzyme
VRRAGAALLGVVLWLVSSCARRDAPNFVLVALDTVGAEHLGYELDGARHTPNLDQLAGEGIVFRRAFSTAPWTQPSIASLFTSRMPSSHGVLRLRHVLSPEAETLAERLGDAGYETAGFVSHDLLQRRLGYAQGFGHWNQEHVGGHEAITSAELTDSAIDWLDARRGQSPFFLFVHYFDPHFVYQHHPAHDLTAGYAGPLEPGMDIWKLRNQRGQLTPEDLEYLVGLYREEIGFTDRHLGRLLRRLDTLGVAEDTVIVVVADHGEEFMRHGWIGHTRTLYDELLRVPLLVRLPGASPGREVRAPVSLLDVAPTLLELAGVPADPRADGISLVPFLTSDASPPSRDLYAEVSFEAPPRDVHEEGTVFRTALIRGDLKLVHDLVTDRFSLYDRGVDPEELVDIADSHSDADSLRAALRAWEETRGSDSLGRAELLEPDDEELERLRALGYVR